MSAPRPTRRRTAQVLAVLGLVAVLGVACHPDNTPNSYTAQNNLVQDNFVQGCTGEGTGTTLAPTNGCNCAISWIIANVPYDDANKKTPTTVQGPNGDISQTFDSGYEGDTFKQIDSGLANNPGNLPQSNQDGIGSACASQGWKVPASSGSQGGGPTTIPQ